MVRLLPDEGIHSKSQGEGLPRPDCDRTLESAIGEFRGFLPADGTGDGDEDSKDYSEYFREFESQAQRIGAVFDGLEPTHLGGREHDLTYDDLTGTVLKFTKPSAAAYVVNFDFDRPSLSTGLPLQYLERQALHNEIFADSITFVGIGGERHRRRIITRQKRVDGGPARWEPIVRLMVENLGFTKLRHNHGIGYEDSYAFVREDVAVFDLRPANVIETESGLLVPIDSIPVRLTEETRRMLR